MKYANPIDDLKTNIAKRGGLAHANFFAVTFPGPASISPNPFLINTICESVQLPGRTITTFEHGMTQQPTKRPYSFINSDVTLTFLITNDFYIKNLFDKWMRCVVNDSDAKVYYKDQYVSDMTISVLDREHDMIYKVNLEKAYPIDMSVVELSNTAENTILKLTVTMTYDNYTTQSTYFSLVTTLEMLKDAISFPNPLMPSIPFSPFGDLGAQKDALLQGLKAEFNSEMSAILNDITSQLRNKISTNTTSITTAFQGSLTNIKSQISGEIRNIFGGSSAGGSLSGIVGKAQGEISTATSRLTSGSSNTIG